MTDATFLDRIRTTLWEMKAAGLEKPERVMLSAQGPVVQIRDQAGVVREAINLCANNYLGLANDPRLIAAAAKAAKDAGGGFASVRFICGTHALHKDLEARIAAYLGFEDAILFAAAFDANGGVFEALLTDEDAVISDSLNHASIIDGVRLSKAKRYRYTAGHMGDLEGQLVAARAAGARTILVATDGVFSMDGVIADLAAITALADTYDALVLVDDCHATGLLGENGRGSAEHNNVEGRIDILTGTFGKALGGAMGGFVAARREVIALLRQRARPYLFSNALPPSICAAALEAIDIADSSEGAARRVCLAANAQIFRTAMTAKGFNLVAGAHPIIPIMLGDAKLAQDMAQKLLEEGVFVTGFSFPVVPHGKARIRTQLSSAHLVSQVVSAVDAFERVRDALGDAQ